MPTMPPLSLIDSGRLQGYLSYGDWYAGLHPHLPRGQKVPLRLNYCRPVADKAISFLLGRGLGFSVPPTREGNTRDRARAERAEAVLYDVQLDADLDVVDLQVASNSIVYGDGVYQVSWDPERGIRVTSLDPSYFFAEWAAGDTSKLLRVEVRYRAVATDAGTAEPQRSTSTSTVDVVQIWTDSTLFSRVGSEEKTTANPYGFVPFVHVPNLPGPNEFWGRSELVDVVPLQHELNERVRDRGDTIRYHADPPVVFKGVTDHTDLAVGPGTVWDIPADSAVELLEWRGNTPDVTAHIRAIREAIFEVSETPRAAFGEGDAVFSGIALETQLRPLIQKTLRRRVFWTRALRRRGEMILRLAELFGVGGAKPGVFSPYRSRVVWPPMVPRDDEADVRNNVALVAAGLRSHRTAMDVLGTESPEEELLRVVADRELLDVPEAPPEGPKDPVRSVGRPRESGGGGDVR